MRFLLLAILLSSCVKEQKPDQFKEVIASTLSNALAVSLQCENVAVIKEDISKLIGMEKSVERTFVGKALCAPMVKTIVPIAIRLGVPMTWGCALTTLNESIDQLIIKSCGQE